MGSTGTSRRRIIVIESGISKWDNVVSSGLDSGMRRLNNGIGGNYETSSFRNRLYLFIVIFVINLTTDAFASCLASNACNQNGPTQTDRYLPG